MKRQLEEYENKIKMLIKELEDESKRHIKETNEVHDYYRGFKSSAQELDQRIKHYKADCDRAIHGERESKKEVVKLTLENDELAERVKFMD
jgi:soluble cytochrome b562